MASSSSPHTWRYNVFTSFRVPDVRKTFLSHLRKEFNRYGITMAPEPTQGIRESIISIRESRISIIVLSKNFASSAWCLDELLEILKCKEEMGHIVMPIFYGVDPTDVQKQTGYFWRTFEQFCAGITEEKEEKRRRWSQALKYVSNIPGEVSQNWDNESKMIEKIARDVSNILFTGTKSRYSTGMSYLVVINLLVEIGSAVADQLSSIHKHYFARISLLLSFLSVVISILDLSHKIRAHKARFLCNWPIPWFYYNGDNKIFGSFADTVLLFCAVGQLIVSTINYSFIERSREGPIKVSVWPLFFAIGMVISKFMGTQPIPRTFYL